MMASTYIFSVKIKQLWAATQCLIVYLSFHGAVLKIIINNVIDDYL